ncbi:MAG TPA: hypothetical protein VM165_00125 [Planctomycetaceae bacterium]|nr:hypothetical protein [Planctomycetaceae bacterium]
MIARQIHLDHLTSDLDVCGFTAERLAAKANLSEDDAKARFSSDLLDAVRERRSRMQQKLTALRSHSDLAWPSEVAAAASHDRPWNAQTTTGTLT